MQHIVSGLLSLLAAACMDMVMACPVYTHPQPDTLIKINYTRENLSLPREYAYKFADPVTHDVEFRQHFIFDDSLGFYYLSNIRFRDPYKKIKGDRVGEKLIHHSSYARYYDGLYYNVINFPTEFEPIFLVDTLKNLDWKYFDQTKTIKDLTCYLAIAVTEKQDSIVAWFTTRLPARRNMALYAGLPGVALEIYDQRYNFHLKAYKIEFLNKQIMIPEGIRVVDKAGWFEEKKKRQKPAAG